MTAMPVAQYMTADEYLATEFDERRRQLIDREVALNETRLPHQRVLVRLLFALEQWLRAEPGRGESNDIGAKKSGYERAGLPELWLVDTAADEVLVFRRSRPGTPTFGVSLELTNQDTLTSPLLPAFELPLSSLF